MRSLASRSVLELLEPHHRPLVWAGGAAFFGFPLFQGLLSQSITYSTLWLGPSCVCAALAVVLSSLNRATGLIQGDSPYATPISRIIGIISLAVATGWFLAGSSALTTDHIRVDRSPRVDGTAASGGTLVVRVDGDGRRRGAALTHPVEIQELILPDGTRLGARGRIDLSVSGGREQPRDSVLSVELNRKAGELLGASNSALTVSSEKARLLSPPGGISALRTRLRRGANASFRRLGASAAPLAQALLLGNRDNLSPGFLEAVRRAGGTHLLALSGMHLAVLATALGAILFPLLGRRAGVIAFLVLLGYFWIVGPIASLLRALLMFGFGAFLKLWGAKPDPKSALCAALLLGGLLAPELVGGVGWRLSTLALGGILWVGVPLYNRGIRFPGGKVWAALTVSLGAFLATAPISLSIFGAAYPASLVASLLLTPLVLLAIVVSLFSFLPPLFPGLLRWAGGSIYEAIETVSLQLSRLSSLSGSDGWALWLSVAVGVGLLLLLPYRRLSGRTAHG